MTATEEILADNARRAAARFFLRVGQAGNQPWRDEWSGQLLGIAEYLRCDGLLKRSPWRISHRFDREALPLADRHYNRRKIGSPQFVPPGRCFVIRADAALWVTSWPFAQYVRHAWPGAWVNSLFRREDGERASELIRLAVAHTRAFFGEPPALGMISFVDPKHVKPVMRRGKPIYGYCYLKAGFRHAGFTKGGLWTWQMLPSDMPAAEPCDGLLAKDAAPTRKLPAVSSASRQDKSASTTPGTPGRSGFRAWKADLAPVRDSAQQSASDAAYLAKCEAAIRSAAREMA